MTLNLLVIWLLFLFVMCVALWILDEVYLCDSYSGYDFVGILTAFIYFPLLLLILPIFLLVAFFPEKPLFCTLLWMVVSGEYLACSMCTAYILSKAAKKLCGDDMTCCKSN